MSSLRSGVSFGAPARLAFAIIAFAGSSAGAQLVSYGVAFSGPSESPPNNSPGTGWGFVTVDFAAVTMYLHCEFSGLIGNVTASHIHAATAVPGAGNAGVATTLPTFAGFPSGVTSGTYTRLLSMTLASSYNPAYVTAHGGTIPTAFADLMAAFEQGRAYWNIHSTAFGGGEIRGFLRPIPAPGAFPVLAVGTMCLIRRRRN